MSATAPSKEQLLAERARKAKRVASAAQRKAATILDDTEMNRSTRNRNSLKIKAEALDEIAEVLSGKG